MSLFRNMATQFAATKFSNALANKIKKPAAPVVNPISQPQTSTTPNIVLPKFDTTPIGTPVMTSTPKVSPAAVPKISTPQPQKTESPIIPVANIPKPQVATNIPTPVLSQPSAPAIPQIPVSNTPQEANDIAAEKALLEQQFAERIAQKNKTGQAPLPTPAVPQETLKAIQSAEEAYRQSLNVTPEELATQEDIDRLAEATRKGYQQIEGQTIPLGFITGQLASLEKRSLALAEPLERKLARLQAARLGANEASKFALQRAEQKLEQEQKLAQSSLPEIQEFGGNLVRVFPDGRVETIAEAPTTAGQFTLSPGQMRFDEQGNVVASVPETIDEFKQAKDTLDIQIKQLELQNKQKDIQNGVLSDSEIKAIDTSPQGKNLLSLNELFTKVNSYKTLIESYGRGGLSPGQNAILNNSWSEVATSWKEAANLGALAGPDIGLVEKNIPLASGIGVLQKKEILNVLDQALGKIKQSSTKNYEQLILRNPRYADSEYVQSLNLANYSQLDSEQFTPEELQYIQSQGVDPAQLSFNQVGSDTNQAEKIAAAIKQVESGSNYNARGASGEGGAYQFMPATWRSWASQYLGDQNAPQTPQNQDIVAKSKIQDLLNQGYNAQQIALIWNGGQPVVKKGVNRFGVQYDSGAYANKVLSALNNFS